MDVVNKYADDQIEELDDAEETQDGVDREIKEDEESTHVSLRCHKESQLLTLVPRASLQAPNGEVLSGAYDVIPVVTYSTGR